MEGLLNLVYAIVIAIWALCLILYGFIKYGLRELLNKLGIITTNKIAIITISYILFIAGLLIFLVYYIYGGF